GCRPSSVTSRCDNTPDQDLRGGSCLESEVFQGLAICSFPSKQSRNSGHLPRLLLHQGGVNPSSHLATSFSWHLGKYSREPTPGTTLGILRPFDQMYSSR